MYPREGKMGQPLMFGIDEGERGDLGEANDVRLDSLCRQPSQVKRGGRSMIRVSICQSLQGHLFARIVHNRRHLWLFPLPGGEPQTAVLFAPN